MLFIPFLEVVLHTYIDNHTEDDPECKAKEEEMDEEARNAFKAEFSKKLSQITEVRVIRFCSMTLLFQYEVDSLTSECTFTSFLKAINSNVMSGAWSNKDMT